MSMPSLAEKRLLEAAAKTLGVETANNLMRIVKDNTAKLDKAQVLVRVRKYSDAPGHFVQVYPRSFYDLNAAIKHAQEERWDVVSIHGETAGSLGMPDELAKKCPTCSKDNTIIQGAQVWCYTCRKHFDL